MILWLMNMGFAGSAAEVMVWTTQTDTSTTWSDQTDASTTWTPQ